MNTKIGHLRSRFSHVIQDSRRRDIPWYGLSSERHTLCTDEKREGGTEFKAWLDQRSYIWISVWTLRGSFSATLCTIFRPTCANHDSLDKSRAIISCLGEVHYPLRETYSKSSVDKLLHKTLDWKCKQGFLGQTSFKPKTTGNRGLRNRPTIWSNI